MPGPAITCETRTFTVTEADGVTHTLAYHVWQSQSKSMRPKQAVICVHGLSRNGRDFDYLAETLAAADHFVVYCLDVVGRGDSEYLHADSKETYGYPLYIKDAFAFVQHLGLSTVDFWIGTSMGGIIAMSMCAQNPRIIRHLVLNDIGSFVSRSSIERLMEYVGKDPHFDTMEDANKYVRHILAPFGALSDENWAKMTEHSVYLDTTVNKYRFKYDPRIRDSVTPADVDLEPLFTKIESKLLVLHGADSDILTDATLKRMKELKPDMRIVDFPNVGHAPSLMVLEQVDWISDFLMSNRD